MMVSQTISEKAFPKLDEDDLRQIEQLATCQSYNDGDEILKFGQSDIDLFIIERGSVDILNPMNDDKLIVTHDEGMFIGDIDLLTRRPIIFRAIARGDGSGGPTRVLCVPNDKLRTLLNTVPRVGEKLLVAFQVRRELLAKTGVVGVRVIGPPGCGLTNRVREFLHKNFVPFTWFDSDAADGKAHLSKMNRDVQVPLVDIGNGTVLSHPTLQQVAQSAGVWRGCPDKDVDLAVVGAGPAGIAAAVYAASEGLRTIVLDQLGPGGQAGGSSKIENFIGFPAGLSGTDLATRGVLQMLKFGAQIIAPVSVDRITPAADEHSPHQLHLSCGTTIRAGVVLACTGVTWRRLPAENADRFERAGVYYACTAVEARLHNTCDVAVVGAGNSAGQAAMFLAEQCRDRTVHMVIRRHLGPGMSEYLVNRIRGTRNIQLHEHAEITAVRGGNHIDAVEITDRDSGDMTTVKLGGVFVFIGAEPRTDWLPDGVLRDKAGYVVTGTEVAKSGRWTVENRDPCPLETTVPRILAGGDLRSGSTKRVGFAVGDGSLAVTCVHHLRAVMNAVATS